VARVSGCYAYFWIFDPSQTREQTEAVLKAKALLECLNRHPHSQPSCRQSLLVIVAAIHRVRGSIEVGERLYSDSGELYSVQRFGNLYNGASTRCAEGVLWVGRGIGSLGHETCKVGVENSSPTGPTTLPSPTTPTSPTTQTSLAGRLLRIFV